ncbi:MAG: hypothetical protein K0M60_01580 [Hydrogenophaga sp.]|nr:hypothetical protein [Hydrogenophaga sp.]
MDADLEAALEEAFAATAANQTEEFKRRFRRLVENALVSNHADSEVRRVLELVQVDEGDDE